jgi:hypothetical protein
MDDSRSVPKRCEGTRLDGQPCTAPVLGVGARCFAHDEAKRAARDAARKKGGHQSASLARVHRLVPPRLLDVFDVLEQALGEVHDGTLPPSQAMAMAALARAMVSVLTAGELEERMRRVEGRAG